MIDIFKSSQSCIDLWRGGSTIEAQFKITFFTSKVIFSDHNFTTFTKIQYFRMVSIQKLMVFITLSHAFRWIGVGQSAGCTFKADISAASLTVVPLGVDVKIFPTSNTLKCHFFIVVSKFCPENWMIWLAYKRCIDLSDFLLQLLIEHVWCDSALDTDLNVLDNLIIGQIRASITGEM